MIEPPDPDLPNGEPSRPPVLDKMDALLSRHRPTRAPFPVLTEPVEAQVEPRPVPKPLIRPKSRDFPSLLDPDAPPVRDSQRLPLPERPPELEVMLDLDVPVLAPDLPKPASPADPQPVLLAPPSVAPMTVTPPVLPSGADLEATTVLELQWEDAELHLQPLELDIPDEWVSAPMAPSVVTPIPEPVSVPLPAVSAQALPERGDTKPADIPPAVEAVLDPPIEPVLVVEAAAEVEPVWEVELETELAREPTPLADVVAEVAAVVTEPLAGEVPMPEVTPAPIVDIPVLTELMVEHEEAGAPLLPAQEREQWVSELVDEVMAGLAPRIAALVRAQLGLQIGGLMKTVTDKVSEQLLADWRDELQHKVEQRLAAHVPPRDPAV